MKIGIITDSVGRTNTGIGYYTKSVCQYLTKNSHTKKHRIKYIDYEKNSFNESRLMLVKNIFLFFRTYLWHNFLPFKIKKNDFNYIMSFSGIPHFKQYSSKEIFFIYDLSMFVVPETHPHSRVLIYKLLLGKTIKNCYKIVVISQSTKQDLIRYYHVPENKIMIIYPPFPKMNNNQQKPKIQIKKQFILYLGTLEPRKNITLIIKALHQLKSMSLFPYQLIIAGKKGWGFKEIFDMVYEFGLEKEVVFTGYVSDAEKKYLYKHADLFIYPSLYEGFGIPPLEAMHYGCPVITSNTSSLPEVVGNAGLIINPYNVEALVSAIIKVLNNKKLKKEMIEKGFKQAKKFRKDPSEKFLKFIKV